MSLFYQKYINAVQEMQTRYYEEWTLRNFRNLGLGYLAFIEHWGVSIMNWMKQGWMERESFRAHGVTVR